MVFNFYPRPASKNSIVRDELKETSTESLKTKNSADELVDYRDASAYTAHYVTHALLLDPQKRLAGYRLAWLAVPGHEEVNVALQMKTLVTSAAKHFNAADSGWSLGRNILFFDVTADSLPLDALQSLPPENVVLCLGLDDLTDAGTLPTLLFLREQGFGFMLCHAQALPKEPEVRGIITHFDVGTGDPDLVASIWREQAPGQAPGQRHLHLIATRMATWEGFDSCAARGVSVFVDGACAHPPVKARVSTLQPESLLIVQLMQMVRRDVDVRKIEALLKYDAVLSYRLLRYINSPAIGLRVEIHSLRHAVAMLGYSPLFRWLSSLLATSNTRACSPFMMQKAIMRGRFVELMGEGMLTASDSDELFVVGMLSLIDQLLGVSMEEALARVPLTEPVQQAILTRGGVYGPFLALAETCERDGSHAARLSEALFMKASQVNAAHLSAMVWSQDMNPA